MVVKDTWDDRINKMKLDRLEERVEALYHRGNYPEALKAAQLALETARESYGQDHPYVLACLKNLDLMEKAIEDKLPSDRPEIVHGADFSAPKKKKGKKTLLAAAAVFVVVLFGSLGFAGRINSPEGSINHVFASVDPVTGNTRPYYRVNASYEPLHGVIEGEEEVVLELKEPVEELFFNLYFNRYRNSSLNSSEIRSYALNKGNDQGYIDIQWVLYRGESVPFKQEGELLRITQRDRLFSTGEHSIKIGFKVKIPNLADRSGGNKDGVWIGNWLPTLNTGLVEYKPTEIGDPFVNFTGTYELEFTVPSEYQLVLSNIDNVTESGNVKIYRATLERVRDLPIFLNKGYQVAKSNQGDTDILYYYSSAGRPGEVLAAAKKALAFYEASFGEYPWKQLNIVENDMFLNGMEYSTLVLISSKAVQKSLVDTVFHEVGHQWFYNIVGSDQYNAPYIDEGLVEFCTLLGLGYTVPGYQPDPVGLTRIVSDFSSWREYREVHYRNGRRLFERIYVIMGKNEFEKFIKEYYDRYKFGLVTQEEFRMFLAGKIGEDETRRLLD